MPNTRSSIDEQVVKMSFDNSNFDSNINESIKTLNSLDTSLGLLNKEDFSGLKNNISDLANVFTVKGQIMLGVFTTLGNKIVQVGNDLKNKLFAGIKDGLGEYKLIIDSTQTIYQNVKKYASLDDVNKALDELNEYADLTIYNFSEMTRMIGMFTSAGVNLNKSVATIKGLANAAALVGANSEKAQIAWQAVSRAMSSGQFTNLTWKSLEITNIAGEQFNKVITEVARANNVVGKSGKNIDEMIQKYGSLRLTLSEGWLTKDIFTEAMQIMSGDLNEMALKNKGYTDEQIEQLLDIAEAAQEAATQVKTFQQLIDTIKEAIGSGWAQSFRILIGDLEEAKTMFTRINNVVSDFIENNAKIRNELFTQIVKNQKDKNTTLVDGLNSGRISFQQTIENMMATIKTFFKAVATGFLNIFPIERISAAAVKVLDTIQKATRALVLNNGKLDKDSGIFGWDTEHVYAISEAIKDLIRFFRGLASAVDIAWMAFSQPIKAIVERIPFFNNFFDKTNGGLLGILKKMGAFGDKITVIRNAFKNSNIIEKAVGYFIDNIDELGEKYPVLGAIVSVFKGIRNAVISLKDGFKKLDIKPLSALFGAFKMIVVSIGKGLNFIFDLLIKAKNSIDWSWLEKPKQVIVNALKALSDYGRGLISFEEITGKIGKSLKKAFSGLKESFDKIFSGLEKVFKRKDSSNELTKSSNKINDAFANLKGTIAKVGETITKIFDKIKVFFTPITDFFKTTFANTDLSLEGILKKILLIGGGVGAAALTISHVMKTIEKIQILDNINALLEAGIDVIKAYQKEIQSKAILNIAISIGILAGVMATLAFIPYENLENGLVIFVSLLSAITVALVPLITALSKFTVSFKDLFKGFAVGVNFLMIGASFIEVSYAILLFVGALAALVALIRYNYGYVTLALDTILKLLRGLAIATLAIVAAMELCSKNMSGVKETVGTFAGFFKLAGISIVIMSIAAAVMVLVGALAIMTKLNPDRLYDCYALLLGLISLLGMIAIGTATIMANAKDMGKLKRITVSFAGAMVGIVILLAALRQLIIFMNGVKSSTVVAAMSVFITVITAFAAMVASLLITAKKVGGQTTIWQKLDKFALIMTANLVAIAGVLYVISKMGDVPDSVVITISILTAALLGVISLLALIAIVIARAKSTFAGNFVNVIEKISFSIAALIAAIGIMVIGVASLVAAINSVDISQSDTNKASSKLVTKLTYIANTINKAIPKLKEIFYNLGRSVGTMFLSFVKGFIEVVLEVGDQFNEIADKIVNLLITLLGRVVDIIYNRRDDIANILRRVIDVIATELTAVVNEFFSKDGKEVITEEQMLNLLGIGGLVVGGGAVLLKVASNFNIIAMSIKNIYGLLGFVNKHLGITWNISNGILRNLNMNSRILLSDISELKIVQNLGNGISKSLSKITGQTITYTGYVGSNKFAWAELGAVILAVVAATNMAEAAYHGFRQSVGKESVYIREDIQSVDNAIDALFADRSFRIQSLVLGGRRLGELFINVGITVIRFLGSVAEEALRLIGYIVQIIGDVALEILAMFDPVAYEYEKEFDAFFDSMEDDAFKCFESIGDIWKDFHWFSDEEFKANWDKIAQQSHEDAEYVGQAASDGFISGYDGDAVNRTLAQSCSSGVDVVKQILGINSPSKVFQDMYYNVMMGSILGMKDGETSFYNYIRHVNETAVGIAAGSASAVVTAWSEILKASGIESTGYDSIRNTNLEIYDQTSNTKKVVELNRDYLELLLAEKEAYVGLDRQAAANHLQQQIRDAGLLQDNYQLIDVIDAVFTNQVDKAAIALAGIEAVDNATSRTILDIFGKSTAATDLAINDAMGNYAEMVALVEDHEEEIVGMKEDEVQAFLKEEALKRGMSEDYARDYSKMISALMFSELGTQDSISEDELKSKIDYFNDEYKAYWELEQDKTAVAQEQAKARVAAAADAWALADEEGITEKMQSGSWSPANLRDWVRETNEKLSDSYKMQTGQMSTNDYINKVKESRKEQDELATKYAELQKSQQELLNKMLGDSGVSEGNTDKFWEDKYNESINLLGKAQSNARGTFKGALDYFKQMLGLGAGALDLSSYDFTSKFGTDNDSILPEDEVSSAIDAASDLKDGLEANRADLTPTFDLDQLASDANKANGIVMSSLMAAQNASIGDYINKDSELNPFMKDRWQNVYNFTQNNYSPKALSRIDIYRQTQRQLSMSRGF